MAYKDKIFIIPLLLIYLSSYYAQNKPDLKIIGNQYFSKDDYLNLLIENNYSSDNDSLHIKRTILTLLHNNGFFNADIQISKDTLTLPNELRIEVNEGNQFYLTDIFCNNCNAIDSVLISSKFYLLKNAPFNFFDIEEVFESILDDMESSGFPFSKIIINGTEITNTVDNPPTIKLSLSLDREKRSDIQLIEIIGNDKTDEDVIKREIRISEGDIYDQKKIDNIPSLLNRLRFFEPVQNPDFYFDSQNRGILKINIKERGTNNFDGIIGYIPEDRTGDKGYISGFVNISLRNLFGTGRAALIKWNQETRLSQELELRYLEPWFFNLPLNINLAINQRKQDTTYVKRFASFQLDYLATETLTAYLTVSSESTIPTENSSNRFTVYNSSNLVSGIGIKIDSRDDAYTPKNGIFFNNFYSFNQKTINGPEEFLTPDLERNITLQKIEIDLNFFYELFKENVVAVGLHLREMRAPYFEISDYYQFGGTNTLRGYREKQFIGNRLFWSNLEYRLLISPRSFAFVFFDSGYYLRNQDDARGIEKLTDFNFGYGLGINFETGIGILGVSFALAEGDNFTDGKIHFGIINEF